MWRSDSQPNLSSRTASLVRAGESAVVISLDVLRREAGAHWTKMRDGIHVRLENLLRLAFGPADFFAAIDDETWLVVAPLMAPEEVFACCLKVAYVLHTTMLGPCGLDSIHIAPATAPDASTLALEPAAIGQLRRLADGCDLDSPVLEGLVRFPPQRPQVPNGSGLVFEPVWNAAQESVRDWRCMTVHPVPLSNSPHKRLGDISERALATLCHAADVLQDHLQRGRAFAVRLPVPFEVIATVAPRMEFIATCRMMPQDLRPFLTFELTSIPEGVAQARLAGVLSTILPFARAVVAQIADAAAPLDGLAGSVCGIGLDLSTVEHARPLIVQLATAAKRLGVTTFLRGLASFDAVEAALETGIAWMSGPAIAAPVGEPQQSMSLAIEALACVADISSAANATVARAGIERHMAAHRHAHSATAAGYGPAAFSPARADDSRRPVRS